MFEIIDNATIVSSTTLIASTTVGEFLTESFSIVAPSNSLLIRITDKTGNTTSSDFYLNTVSVALPAAPIKLLSFDGIVLDNGQVQLDWQTASEVNNDYFIVQRSTDGIQWKEIRQIKGLGDLQS